MFKLGPPKQIAYAVPNAFEAAKKWAEDFGAGPFFISEHIPVTDVLYRGTPATFDHTSAYGQWGDIMVELVQDHGTGPSVVRDLYGPNESGLHHRFVLCLVLTGEQQHHTQRPARCCRR